MNLIGIGFALLGTSNTKFISDNEANNIFNYIKDNPDKAKQWFGKLINKKGMKNNNEISDNEIIGV